MQAVDRGGRVAIPHAFRSLIEARSGERRIVLGFHETLPCLRGYDIGWSERAEEVFARRELAGEDAGKIQVEREAIFGNTHSDDFDTSGRFIIPEFFRKEAGIDKQVIFVGAGPTFNLWAPDVLMATPGISEITRRRCADLLAAKRSRQ